MFANINIIFMILNRSLMKVYSKCKNKVHYISALVKSFGNIRHFSESVLEARKTAMLFQPICGHFYTKNTKLTNVFETAQKI